MAEQDPQGGEVVACIDAAIALSAEAPLGGWDLHRLGGAWVGEEALAITIAVVLAEDDINKALLLAVNHSGDSDSTGAMVGNVLGALHGTKTLKNSWQQEVEIADVITDLAERLAGVGR
jgi:ADP-ribosylglycohydrolase